MNSAILAHSAVSSPRSFFRWLPRFLGIQAAILLIVFGALGLGLVVLPLRALLFGKPDVVEARRIISRAVRLYLWILAKTRLIKVDFEQLPLPQAVVLVANHPSLFDVLFFIAQYPSCCCVVKRRLYQYSPYAFVIRWGRYIVNSRSDLLEATKQEFRAGRSLIIFPEGTRSDAAGGNLQRGAAAIALRAGVALQVFHIFCDPPALGKRRAWYEVPSRCCEVKLIVGPRIDTAHTPDESLQRAARRLTAEIAAAFERRPPPGVRGF